MNRYTLTAEQFIRALGKNHPTVAEAKALVAVFRKSFPAIAALWRKKS